MNLICRCVLRVKLCATLGFSYFYFTTEFHRENKEYNSVFGQPHSSNHRLKIDAAQAPAFAAQLPRWRRSVIRAFVEK